MTGTDLLLLAVIGASTLLGLMRGLIGVLASIAAWVLAGWAAFRFGGEVARQLAGGVDPGASQLLAGYGLSFVLVMVLVGFIGWLVRRLLKSIGLSGVDRALGGAFGLARGALVACVLVLLMGFSAMPADPGWRQSRVVPVLMPGAQWLRGWLPDWAARQVRLEGATPLLAKDSVATGEFPPQMIDNGNAPALPQPGG